jgi:hypothetical protein
VRGTHEAGACMAHGVSAWHTRAGVTRGQVRTAAQSNEITAIPDPVDALDITGATGVASSGYSQPILSGLNVVVAPVPEPETLALTLAGLGLVAMARRHKAA